MSATTHKLVARKVRGKAPLFAALGDETRLTLLVKLGGGQSLSITQLTDGEKVSRQAITKHLRVLEEAGLVRAATHGREKLFQLTPKPLDEAKRTLDEISRHWDEALARLKKFVEKE